MPAQLTSSRSTARRLAASRAPARAQRRTRENPTDDKRPAACDLDRQLGRAQLLGHRWLRVGTISSNSHTSGRGERLSRAPETVTESAPSPVSSGVASGLPSYQYELLLWAQQNVDETIDPNQADAYPKLRRRLWYSHRTQVVKALAGGAGLGPAEAKHVEQQIDGWSHHARLRFTGWLLGDQGESTKLKLVGELGRANGGPESLPSTDRPATFRQASVSASPPRVEKLKSLADIEAVLDYWELETLAFGEAVVEWARTELAARELESKADNGSMTGGFLRWLGGVPEPTRTSDEFFRAMTADYRPEGVELKDQLATFAACRADLRRAKVALTGLGPLANGSEASDDKVRGVLAEGHSAVGSCQERLRTFLPQLEIQLSSRQAAEEYIGENQRRIAKLDPAAAIPWYRKAYSAVTQRVGELSSKLTTALSDPSTLLEIVEVGLEVAGALATGGASVLVRLGLWAKQMFTSLKGGIASFGKFSTGLAHLRLADLGRIFSGQGLIKTVAGALFGEVPQLPTAANPELPEMKLETTIEAGKAQGKLDRLLRRIVASGRALAGAWTSVATQVPELLAKVDLTRKPFFRPLATAVTGLAAARKLSDDQQIEEGLKSGIDGLRTATGSAFGKLRATLTKPLQGVRTVLQKLDDPAGLAVQLADSVLNFVLGLLVFKPPSAILRSVLKVFRALSDQDLVSLIRSRVPILDAGISWLRGSSLVQGLMAPMRQPVERLGNLLGDLESGADGLIDPLQQAADQALTSPEALVQALAGSVADGKQASPGEQEVDPIPTAPATATGRVDPAALPALLHGAAADQLRRSVGHQLAPALAEEMGGALGHDFSTVQLHEDAPAQRANELLGARALTRGRHIYFGTGELQPQSPQGRRLLTHELTHVVQQSRAGVGNAAPPGTPLQIPTADHPSEVEAEKVAAHLAHASGERQPGPIAIHQSPGQAHVSRAEKKEGGPGATFLREITSRLIKAGKKLIVQVRWHRLGTSEPWTVEGTMQVLTRSKTGSETLRKLNQRPVKTYRLEGYWFMQKIEGEWQKVKKVSSNKYAGFVEKPDQEHPYYRIYLEPNTSNNENAATLVHEIEHLDDTRPKKGEPRMKTRLANELRAHLAEEQFKLEAGLKPGQKSYRKGGKLDREKIKEYVDWAYPEMERRLKKEVDPRAEEEAWDVISEEVGPWRWKLDGVKRTWQ